MPDATPPTIPVLLTVAAAVLVLLQAPPDVPVPSLNAVVEPAHTVAVPVIVPATGSGLTVTTCVAATVPQLPVVTV